MRASWLVVAALSLAACGDDCEPPGSPAAVERACDAPAVDATFTGDDLYVVSLCNEANESWFGNVVAANLSAAYVDLESLTLTPSTASGTATDADSGDELLSFDITVSTVAGSFFVGTTSYGQTTWVWDNFTATAVDVFRDDAGRLQEGSGYAATRVDGAVDLGNGEDVTLVLYLYEVDNIPVVNGWLRYSAIGYVSEIVSGSIRQTGLAPGPVAAVLSHAVLAEWAQNSGIELGP